MKVHITTLEGNVCSLEVSGDLDYGTFCALVKDDLNIAKQAGDRLVFLRENKPLTSTNSQATLSSLGVQDGDMLMAQCIKSATSSRAAPNSGSGGGGLNLDFSSIRIPVGGSRGRPTSSNAAGSSRTSQEEGHAFEAELYRQSLLSNPEQLTFLRERNPALANAVNDKVKFLAISKEIHRKMVEHTQEIGRLLSGNQFDPEIQARIEEKIRQQNIENQLVEAMEHHPEHFARVTMLYIKCQVFGKPVKAFIDSGAETTIMSEACAKRCFVDRLIDTRFQGIAKGVGTQTILGRVHAGVIQIGSDFLTSSFSVLQNQQMDLLIGLDMLKRHQCCIDLRKNVLHIGTTGSEVPFLPESELPDFARLNYEDPDLQPPENPSNEKVGVLMDHGFSLEVARAALDEHHGDVDAALASLLARTYQSS